MQIIVDGHDAVLKQGSSFDFIAENRLFSGSDSYTLTITFPLKDCPQNVAIFGQIHRSEIVPQDISFDCEIRDKAFSRFGTLTITEISDIELKAQFLEGRAVQNFAKDFDETYINDLDIGKLGESIPAKCKPLQAWDPFFSADSVYPGPAYVALPWVSADSGIAHNFAVFDENLLDEWGEVAPDLDENSDMYAWASDTRDLTYMPYLLYLTARICNAMGYEWDLSEWEEHPWLCYVLVCNVLPGSWDFNNYARSLPRWTVAEYFEKLEIFLRGEFNIDHMAKTVSFRFSSSVLSETAPVRIEKVVDEFSSSVKPDGDGCDYLESKTLAYKNADHQLSNYYSCQWLVSSLNYSDVAEFDSVLSLLSKYGKYIMSGKEETSTSPSNKDPDLEKIFYVPEEDMHFMLRHCMRAMATGNKKPVNYYSIQPLNMFGTTAASSDDNSNVELEFVPACIDYTEPKYGEALFMNFGSYSEEYVDSEFMKSTLQHTIENGEKSDTPEYYDLIYVAYYDGNFRKGVSAHPDVSNIINDARDYGLTVHRQFNFRLNDPKNELYAPFYRIDRTRKVTFKFMADNIPNPRALFYIHGRRYICEKITATFTEDGMSQLLKGEFWPLLDD